MKNCNYLIISVVLFGLLFFSPNVLPQTDSTQKDISENSPFNPAMSFNIALDKTEYFQLEPITLRCKFSNKTKEPQTTFIPSFKNESRLEVGFNGESKQFNQISYLMIFLTRPPEPVTFQPGKGVEEEITLETSLDEFFPKPGIYTIRLSVKGSENLEGNSLWSNPVEITILEPRGINKEAFDFIQQNKINRIRAVLFHWNNDIKLENGKTLLEEFVSKYSGSVYGEIGIYQLGNYYRQRQECEKAKIELKKLKFSKNPRIVKDAKATLSDVEKSSCAKENDKPQ